MDDNTDDSLVDSIPYGMSRYNEEDCSTIKRILENLLITGNINRKNKEGQTPLHRFAKKGNWPDIDDFLLENGADVNVQDQNGDTPLHLVAIHNSFPEVRKFIVHGANLDLQNNRGFTPLMNACFGKESVEERYGDYRCVALFIAHGANLDLQNEDGNTALILSCHHSSYYWMDFMFENVKRLVAAGADMNKQNNEGDTALMVAIRNGDYEKAYFLVSCGANTDIQNNRGETALSIAESIMPPKKSIFFEEELINILKNKTKIETVLKYKYKSDKSKKSGNGKQYE